MGRRGDGIGHRRADRVDVIDGWCDGAMGTCEIYQNVDWPGERQRVEALGVGRSSLIATYFCRLK